MEDYSKISSKVFDFTQSLFYINIDFYIENVICKLSIIQTWLTSSA